MNYKSFPLFVTGIVSILVVLLANNIYQHDFHYGKKLSRTDFEYPLNYTVAPIPTTYYCSASELDKLISGWDHRPIHLYRASQNCRRDVNLGALRSTVRARRIVDKWGNETALCAHSTSIPPKEDVHLIDIQEALSNPGWYVNFDCKSALFLSISHFNMTYHSTLSHYF
jgi:hypothetical protein